MKIDRIDPASYTVDRSRNPASYTSAFDKRLSPRAARRRLLFFCFENYSPQEAVPDKSFNDYSESLQKHYGFLASYAFRVIPSRTAKRFAVRSRASVMASTEALAALSTSGGAVPGVPP